MRSFANEYLPVDSEELKEVHRDTCRGALEEFRKCSVGSEVEEYVKELKAKMKQKYAVIAGDNERETKKCVYDFLSRAYMSIEQKLKSNEFKSFDEYARELKGFQAYFMQNGPPGPNRRVLMLEYCQKAQAEVSAILENKVMSEMELQSLSLIHICRCRRYAVCRSRWSPYH
eukprot:TRINITY_DN26454_c0_g1_i1.p1 TRINITY_DN26454_c0_g1~~TRINITY_DN26454_c0_g1_i1.p1  ORF type:complete len:172 (+),score=51.56 TRINITY_DN26454_c0_g1_i1:145-660(+)